jgi:hypothetical protein
MHATIVTPLSCGGWGYLVLDAEGAPVSAGGGERVSRERALEIARKIARNLDETRH